MAALPMNMLLGVSDIHLKSKFVQFQPSCMWMIKFEFLSCSGIDHSQQMRSQNGSGYINQ